jgi:TIR domain
MLDQLAPPLRVFLNYRRSDTAPYAQLLGDALRARFGESQIFTDVDTIPFGVDFAKLLSEHIESCDVLITLIGKDWLTASDEEGRRLDHPDDWLRLEIEAALKRDVRVIPALVEGAEMPKAHELPESLRPLTVRNYVGLRDGKPWHSDVETLIADLERFAPEVDGDELGQPWRAELVEQTPWLRSMRAHVGSSTHTIEFRRRVMQEDAVVRVDGATVWSGPFMLNLTKSIDFEVLSGNHRFPATIVARTGLVTSRVLRFELAIAGKVLYSEGG